MLSHHKSLCRHLMAFGFYLFNFSFQILGNLIHSIAVSKTSPAQELNSKVKPLSTMFDSWWMLCITMCMHGLILDKGTMKEAAAFWCQSYGRNLANCSC